MNSEDKNWTFAFFTKSRRIFWFLVWKTTRVTRLYFRIRSVYRCCILCPADLFVLTPGHNIRQAGLFCYVGRTVTLRCGSIDESISFCNFSGTYFAISESLRQNDLGDGATVNRRGKTSWPNSSGVQTSDRRFIKENQSFELIYIEIKESLIKN